MFRAPHRKSDRAGFTLIEVLVALAVIATSLTAIGALVAVSMRGAQSIGQRLAFRETLRALVTSLPDRRDLDAGTATGTSAGVRWRLDIVPFSATFVDPQAPTPWEPEAVVVTVRSPSGQQLQINTIRLRRKAGQQPGQGPGQATAQGTAQGPGQR